MWDSFHFLRPYFFLLLCLFIPVVFLLSRQKGERNCWQVACDPHLLPYLLIRESRRGKMLPLILLALAWFLTIVALAGPTWSKETIQAYESLRSRVIVLDLSEAMLSSDLSPSRYYRAKYKIREMLERNKKNQIGIVVFTQKAYSVSPLTEDAATLTHLVRELSPAIMPTPGNNLAAGIAKATELLSQAGAEEGDIIVFTATEPNASAYELAQRLKEKKIRLSVIGTGTLAGGPVPLQEGFMQDSNGNMVLMPLPEKSLAQLANIGNGTYQRFQPDDSDLEQLDTLLSQAALKESETEVEFWQDKGRLVIWLILPLALCAFRRGWYEQL